MSWHFLGRTLPNLALIRVLDFRVSHPILQTRCHCGANQVGPGHSLLSFSAQQWQGWLRVRFDLFWAKQERLRLWLCVRWGN